VGPNNQGEKMQRNLIYALATAAALIACNKKGEQAQTARTEPQVEDAPQSQTPPAKPTATVPDSFQAGIGKVYEGYLRIESALAHDDFKGAKEAFQSMHAVLHVLPKGGLDSVQKAHWDSLDAPFMEVLHPMAASKDIAEMRNHLADFTPLVVEALEKFGARTPNHAYLFHCPMARNNAGADWLQPDTSRLNPYYGKSMPKCGNFVKEIKTM
jgi:membrane fusion protein, copper/silver efflux system